MTRWRKRIGEAGAKELLKETLETGLRLKAVKTSQLKRVNVYTTFQKKDIRFPTDARLYDRARQRLVTEAKSNGNVLRQNYNRNSREPACSCQTHETGSGLYQEIKDVSWAVSSGIFNENAAALMSHWRQR